MILYTSASLEVKHALHDNRLPVIEPKFMSELYIRKAEEQLMGVPEEDTEAWRQENNIPNSEAFDLTLIPDDIPDSDGFDMDIPLENERRRQRAETMSSGSEKSASQRHTHKKSRQNTES